MSAFLFNASLQSYRFLQYPTEKAKGAFCVCSFRSAILPWGRHCHSGPVESSYGFDSDKGKDRKRANRVTGWSHHVTSLLILFPVQQETSWAVAFFNKSILWRNPVGFWEVFYAGLNAKRVKPDFMPWDWVCHVINKPIFWLQMELPASQRPWQGLVSFILFEWTASPIQEREVMIFSLYNSTEPHSHITITV